ncbi:MAG TPA: type II toxin-antitoxin system mRNA interferase toxin, RelE/StbE family [Cyanobacteria bacterium UBA8553]|nr:type II toxin-antitoxin system mRNA interferase toxin, RelE/StbE family [Cyanobacteria bacterium UBA8553]HAJ60916.1 type II toxin-antitoxin system mRNA interferase toxin, RelE/StbE family [Cyanobacteria bacterium UBA8543]
MANQVNWSPKALEDVDAIVAYIARDSASYAATVVQKILDTTRNLSKFPLTGRIVPEFGDESIREKFAYSDRIIYRIENETVTIAAVIHGKRQLETLEVE